jgi:predicted aconitase
VEILHLTRSEEKMLTGEQGASIRKAMEVLVAIGEIYNAPRLIDVGSVHISGISYVSAGESGRKLVEDFACSGCRFVVPTSSNVIGMDLSRWKELGFPQDFVKGQKDIMRSYESMGITPTYTCTPYYNGCLPRKGEHIAWAESSTIIFANSVLGARTNRESNPSAISSALTGKTPLFGYHLDENRAGSVLVEVLCDLRDSSDYSALGYCIGSQVGSEVPVFKFTKARPKMDDLKNLGAALATSGEVALFHAVGITPEAEDQRSAFHGHRPTHRISCNNADVRRVLANFPKTSGGKVDHVMFGCPHASLNELREIAMLLQGKKVDPDVKTWICTSAAVRSIGERMGVVQAIERSGAHVLADTCTPNVPMKDLGVESMATNSTKCATYCSEKADVNTYVGSLGQCVQCAIDGEWNDLDKRRR